MGGGKKKPTMRQMERAQTRDEGKGKTKVSGRGAVSSGGERRTLAILPPDPKDKAITKELQKMKVLTPYIVASRFNLRLSAAKDFLEELHRQGIVSYISGGRNTKIYKPIES